MRGPFKNINVCYNAMKAKACSHHNMSVFSKEAKNLPQTTHQITTQPKQTRRHSLNRNLATPILPLGSLFGSEDNRSDTDFADLDFFDQKFAFSRSLKQPNLALYNKIFGREGDPYISQKSLNISTLSFNSLAKKNYPKIFNTIPSDPYRILDLPGYDDDYYSTLIVWSARNQIATALQDSVYIFDYETSEAFKLFQAEDENEHATAVTFSSDGSQTAIGTTKGRVLIYDIASEKLLNSVEEESMERVSSMDWHQNGLLAAGKDSAAVIHDFRKRRVQITEFMGHSQNICSISWAPDGRRFATGGSDNQAFVWDLKSNEPTMTMKHKGGVRALCWSPSHENKLATGGGSTDRCIRIWDVSSEALIDWRDTGSQICNLVYSHLTNDIITTHGYPNNEICVWRSQGLKKVGTMTGHEQRPLTLCLSPDKTCILTASSDESMRFWRLFEAKHIPLEKMRTRDNSGATEKPNL